MKRQLYALLISIFFGFSTSLFSQTAPNVTLTDLDGVSHELYAYLDSGYQVILDFSYELCGACINWTTNVGHDLWDTYGPDGENVLRMFFIDVDGFATNSEVASYTQSWGVECPVVNLQGNHPSFPVDGYPALFYICPDRSSYYTEGYGYPASEIFAQYYLNKCQGFDMEGNYSFFSVSQPSSASLCSDSLIYAPEIIIVRSGGIENQTEMFNTQYEVEIFINGDYHSTQIVDPYSDWLIEPYQDEATLEPIPVDESDEVTLVINFEGDAYQDDDTVSVIIPLLTNTQTSTDIDLVVETDDLTSYTVFDVENDISYQSSGNSEFQLSPEICYSITFNNSHIFGGVLKDAATGAVLCSYDPGQYEGYNTPRLYFNVVNSVGINEESLMGKIKDSYYLTLLGERIEPRHLEDLAYGVYLQVIEYQDGKMTVKKRFSNR